MSPSSRAKSRDLLSTICGLSMKLGPSTPLRSGRDDWRRIELVRSNRMLDQAGEGALQILPGLGQEEGAAEPRIDLEDRQPPVGPERVVDVARPAIVEARQDGFDRLGDGGPQRGGRHAPEFDGEADVAFLLEGEAARPGDPPVD